MATYTVDTGKKPYIISMVTTLPDKGVMARGLIEKDGETIRLIYALPDGTLPTEFKTKENS